MEEDPTKVPIKKLGLRGIVEVFGKNKRYAGMSDRTLFEILKEKPSLKNYSLSQLVKEAMELLGGAASDNDNQPKR